MKSHSKDLSRVACLALGAMTTVLLLAPAGKAQTFDEIYNRNNDEMNRQREINNLREEMRQQETRLKNEMLNQQYYNQNR